MAKRNKNNYINQCLDNESGMLMVEFTIYFPLIFLGFIMFILSAFLITQRVVLDRAVAQATSEASMWLGDSMGRVGYDPFSGQEITLRANPYANIIGDVFGAGVFSPLTTNEFAETVSDRVIELAGLGIIGGLGGNVYVDVTYDSTLFIVGTLTVEAEQWLHLPIAGFGFTGWGVESRASATIFRPYILMNDVHFVFDLASVGIDGIVDYVVDTTVEYITNIVVRLIESLVEAALNMFL